ncbi:MAG: M48 family metalloprotease [Gemmataceae bacterium]|nr:M48 family metalloprotease [Gemmataceae bacterium]
MLRLLLVGYYPFVLLLLAGVGFVLAVVGNFAFTTPAGWMVSWPLILWLGLTVVQLAAVVPVWFMEPPKGGSLEVVLPPAFLEPIMQLVARIARDRQLRMPHDIRLSPDAIAHVYNDADRRILVLGGLLVSILSQKALAGVIAHELGHFTTGDTTLSRRAARRFQSMTVLEAWCRGRISMYFNPVIWLIRLYHLAFVLVYCADSRQREFAADRQAAAQAGAEETAFTLLLLETLACLPSLRLHNIAKDFAVRREPLHGIFAEQQRRALGLYASDWEDACRKALQRKTTPWDSHPALRDRLKALGVSLKMAPALLMSRRDGPPARDLFPAWSQLEKYLSNQWLHAARVELEAKQELAQIILGRSRRPV